MIFYWYKMGTQSNPTRLFSRLEAGGGLWRKGFDFPEGFKSSLGGQIRAVWGEKEREMAFQA